MDLEVYDVSNADVRLRPNNPRVFDTPNLEVKRLDCTLTEAELNPMNTDDKFPSYVNCPNHGLNWP